MHAHAKSGEKCGLMEGHQKRGASPLAVDARKLRPVPRDFFAESADVVAPRLLGHYLIRRTAAGYAGGRIVETEAYLVGDPACHSYRGETARNRSMFGPPGQAYVYLIYGLHYCVNAVCQPTGCGEAVLIRAIDVVLGENLMRQRRSAVHAEALTSGPAKLCQALDIDRAMDGVDLCRTDSPLMIAENLHHKQFLLEAGPMITGARIGITQGAELPLRFYLKGSRFKSRP